MISHFLFLASYVLIASAADETLRAYGGKNHVWTLAELNGAPFQATATLTFPQAGVIAGNGPCNLYHGTLTVPYPWFETGPIASTRRACPDLKAEAAFFQALEAASLSEITGDTLILSDDNGVLLVFKSDG